MVDIKTFHNLRKYQTTSWAIWNHAEDSSIDFFLSKLEFLHGKVVFVGLNRSNSWPANLVQHGMPNFHTPGHVADRRLKTIIQDTGLTNLIGGLMTDISDEIETDSGKVKVNPVIAAKELIEKVTSIKETSERHIICFGNTVFEKLKKGLMTTSREVVENPEVWIKRFGTEVAGESWSVYRVWHPSNNRKYLHKSEIELPIQLAYINAQTAI